MRDVVRIHPRADRGLRLADDAVGTADYPAPWPAADHPNPAVAPGPFAQDLRGPIGGTVVQNDELEVAEALADDTLNAGLQVVLAVVDGHHDAKGESISGEQTRGSWEKSWLRTVFNGMQANPVLAIPRSTREGGAGPGRFPRFSGPAPCAILSGNPSSAGSRRRSPAGAPPPESAGPRRSRSSTGRRSSRATTFTRKTAWARPCTYTWRSSLPAGNRRCTSTSTKPSSISWTARASNSTTASATSGRRETWRWSPTTRSTSTTMGTRSVKRAP